MKKLRFATFFASLLFLMASCAATSSVITDYDRDADFSEYRTFFWSDEFQMQQVKGDSEPLFYNTLNKKRLKQAIQREMEARGYTLSSENPDLLVNAQVLVEERTTTHNNLPYRGLYYWGPPVPQTSTTKEGDIVVDLIDQEEHQLVWQGYATGVLDTRTQKREEEIKDAVTIIFANYGRRAGQNTTTYPGR